MIVDYQSIGVVDFWKPNSGLNKMASAGIDRSVLDLAWLEWLFDTKEIEKKKRYANRAELSFLNQPEGVERFIRAYIERCNATGITLDLVIMPSCSDFQEYSERYQTILKVCMQICGEYGIGSIVIPPLQTGWAENRDFYHMVMTERTENQLQILLTNLPRNYNGHYIRGACCDGAEAAAWIDRLNQNNESACFGFFMDMKSCNVCGQNMYEFSNALKEKIKAVRVCDNDGHTLTARIPFSNASQKRSTVDWLSFFRGMRNIEFDGIILLDAADSVAALSTLLKTDFLRYEKKIGAYVLFQIELERTIGKYSKRVLFGAGNMCRNYMKCYGDQYPPLFTCDNNQALWETEFEGLIIKDPQELKKLPKDCAIFICNLYYEEIQQQLEKMGLHNPIEWFNDEYLPLRYTDWFDSSERKLR